jgi:hypothetical protein
MTLEYEDISETFEIDGRTVETGFPGRCTLNYEHKIKRGERVAQIRRKDNPFIPISGVVCKRCIEELR